MLVEMLRKIAKPRLPLVNCVLRVAQLSQLALHVALSFQWPVRNLVCDEWLHPRAVVLAQVDPCAIRDVVCAARRAESLRQEFARAQRSDDAVHGLGGSCVVVASSDVLLSQPVVVRAAREQPLPFCLLNG